MRMVELNDAQAKFLNELLTRYCVYCQQQVLSNLKYIAVVKELVPGTEPIQLSKEQVDELKEEMEHCNNLIEMIGRKKP